MPAEDPRRAALLARRAAHRHVDGGAVSPKAPPARCIVESYCPPGTVGWLGDRKLTALSAGRWVPDAAELCFVASVVAWCGHARLREEHRHATGTLPPASGVEFADVGRWLEATVPAMRAVAGGNLRVGRPHDVREGPLMDRVIP